MDLNRLREQLQQSQPVRVTRTGQLETEEGRPFETKEGTGPSRIKRHTFADRLAEDIRAMDENTGAWHRTVEGQVVFEEEIETNFGVRFHFRMLVPPQYPQVPPRVFCISPDVPKGMEFHTYADGHLCLFQVAEWTSDFTLLDVRNFYCEWAFNVVPKLHGAPGWMSPEHV